MTRITTKSLKWAKKSHIYYKLRPGPHMAYVHLLPPHLRAIVNKYMGLGLAKHPQSRVEIAYNMRQSIAWVNKMLTEAKEILYYHYDMEMLNARQQASAGVPESEGSEPVCGDQQDDQEGDAEQTEEEGSDREVCDCVSTADIRVIVLE